MRAMADFQLAKVLSVLAIPLILLLAGCQTRAVDPREESFSVTVHDHTGRPIEGIIIEGGVDWDSFQVPTDASGRAELPGSANGGEAFLHLNNYFPRRVVLRWPFRYEMTATPQRLRLLGDAPGKVVGAAPGRLATMDYYGNYHLYAIDEAGLTEISTSPVARLIRQVEPIADAVWVSTQHGGIYSYSLADLEHPVEQLHLAIPGDTPVFARRDNVVAVGNTAAQASIGVFSFMPDGTFTELSRFFDSYVSGLAFIGDFLVVTGYSSAHPKIYDISNPVSPVLVWDAADPAFWNGFLFGRAYIQIPHGDSGELSHGRLDLSNPLLPQSGQAFQSDSLLEALINDHTAVGYYRVLGNALSVLNGSVSSGFHTVAIVSEDPRYDLNQFGGCAPPFYVIGERLWVLEERTSADSGG